MAMKTQTPWKKLRARILERIIPENFHNYELPSFPTNLVRFNHRKDVVDLPFDQQEKSFYEDFLSICRGINGPYIQCGLDNDKINWRWGKEDFKLMAGSQNIEQWLELCFEMGTTLFDVLLGIGELRKDRTRGPTVYAFCSLVLKFLEVQVYSKLNDMDKLEVKSLMTLKSVCVDLDHRLLRPLREIVRDISHDNKVGGELINFLFEQMARVECYHIAALLRNIIDQALHRYNQNIFEWVSQCSLSMDLGHEFFIWDLRKQKVVERREFCPGNADEFEFDQTFVRIPELLPKAYEPVACELVNLGRYLFTMRHQNADIEFMSTQYHLDHSVFKDKSLGDFCAIIHELYSKCSRNILEHYEKRFDIVNFAKHLPYFFIGINSAWIYEFVVLLEKNELNEQTLEKAYNENNGKKFEKKLQQLLQEAFHANWLLNSPFHDKIFVRLCGKAEHEKKLGLKQSIPPKLELNIVVSKDNALNDNLDRALSLAFPACVMWPYRWTFFHLLLLNRAKHLMYRKYFALKDTNCCGEEFATVHQFLRMFNVYIEYICGVALETYPNYVKKLDAVDTLDDLVGVQMQYIHQVMSQMMLDGEFVELTELLHLLATTFCEYAQDAIDFRTLGRVASPLVGEIKKFLLKKGGRGRLRDILFGCCFSAIGGTAADEEPIWRLLCHVDDEITFAAAVND